MEKSWATQESYWKTALKVILTDGEILSDTWDFWNEDVRRNLGRHMRLKVISTDGEILGDTWGWKSFRLMEKSWAKVKLLSFRLMEKSWATVKLLEWRRKEKSWATPEAESHFDWWRNLGQRWSFWNEDVRRNLERHLRLKVISTNGEILGNTGDFSSSSRLS